MSFLTQAYILRQEFPRAKAAIETIMPREQQPGNVTERQVALVWGELALAEERACYRVTYSREVN